MSMPVDSVEEGLTMITQSMTKAAMPKALARGPNVAAMRGKRVEENHHRLEPLVNCQNSRE